MRKKTLVVKDNAPLTDLLEEFKTMTMYTALDGYGPGPGLSHAGLLKIFDKALARKDWPASDRDRPVPFVRKRTQPRIHPKRPTGTRGTQSESAVALDSEQGPSKRSKKSHAASASGRTGNGGASRKRPSASKGSRGSRGRASHASGRK